MTEDAGLTAPEASQGPTSGEKRALTVTVYKTNTDPIVFTDVTEVGSAGTSGWSLVVKQQRLADVDDVVYEAACSVRWSVITKVIIEPSASGSQPKDGGT
jgi:hypothetical protein